MSRTWLDACNVQCRVSRAGVDMPEQASPVGFGFCKRAQQDDNVSSITSIIATYGFSIVSYHTTHGGAGGYDITGILGVRKPWGERAGGVCRSVIEVIL